jgi:hypothetical protein
MDRRLFGGNNGCGAVSGSAGQGQAVSGKAGRETARWLAASYSAVRIVGPSGVMAMVRSKWADGVPSAV